MSFITVIFILVPMLAPILGQFILDYFHWHGIFYFQMLFVSVLLFWFGIRQEETLLPSNRIQLTRHLYILPARTQRPGPAAQRNAVRGQGRSALHAHRLCHVAGSQRQGRADRAIPDID